ncbi:hypothetical protein C798_04495 [Herbaspirillum rubrisubalbicans Os34]|uniref:Uncharacterized protein n=1 Tax=Herbaspirillum rubrisubalbicans Os34 TaxID=1235827 RepID=A0A6M3ZLK4_9BURK|nr:hypothetical protein C798_04495 [Herbaspirillum rubrisubalbicans Os34]
MGASGDDSKIKLGHNLFAEFRTGLSAFYLNQLTSSKAFAKLARRLHSQALRLALFVNYPVGRSFWSINEKKPANESGL